MSPTPLCHALEALQLQIARRADELAKTTPRATGMNRECWLLAEAELLAKIELMPEGFPASTFVQIPAPAAAASF